MKVFYQVGDGPWIKGHMMTLSGGREVSFSNRDDDGRLVEEITMWHPEYLIHDSGMHVTGWQRVKDSGDNMYKLVSIDVKTYRPKDKS